jgi:uncharacterized protein YjbI with pentapeptide repeats
LPECRRHEICRLDAENNAKEDLCILHSEDPSKDLAHFEKALDEHCRRNGTNFQGFVFPGYVERFFRARFPKRVDFSGALFTHRANFAEAQFNRGADFFKTKFDEGACFNRARFAEWATFSSAEFARGVDFVGAEFTEEVNFKEAQFTFKDNPLTERANFLGARFGGEAIFYATTFIALANFYAVHFARGADFRGTHFNEFARFRHARFLGRTLFSARESDNGTVQIFSGTEVDFRDVTIEPLDALTFRDAELRKCRFQGTDLRKAEFTGEKWPEIPSSLPFRIGRRHGVYDEIVDLPNGEIRSWAHVERIYRELKQNFEDRRDYERVRDFHYGEKEMRRKYAKTLGPRFWGLRALLFLYCWVGGYGERWVRPFICAGVVLVVSTFCYLQWGLLRLNKTGPLLDCTRKWEAGLYSLKVMTLLKPSNFEPVAFWGDFVNTLQSLLGPILIGLFALALRQRLKR